MDLKQVVDTALSHWQWLLIISALVSLPFLIAGPVRRLWRVIEEMVFTNWQLALLGAAALILSLAGGWTTWDGMRNFTGEPVLSLMFTFGIHGVMLITAWLIGESFATGMSTVPRGGFARVTAPLIVIGVLAVVLLAAALGVYQWRHGIAADAWMQGLGIGGAALLAFALLTVFSRSDVVAPYTQALRIIAKNAMLWVMFLACMSTSVFFSFDSRFNVVFPTEERKRVADLRAQNQVTGILADISSTMTSRRLSQQDELFRSDGWHAYDVHLAKLAAAAQGAQGEIERFFVQQMEEQRRGIAQQQERIATAQSGQAGLASRKVSLVEELGRLKSERPALAAEYGQHKSELDAKAKEVDAKRVEAMAEDRGVEGTLKQGRGPVYRERMAELGRLQDEYKIKEERTKAAQKRLDTTDARIAQIERELSGIDGEIAKFKGEAQTAELRIKAAEETGLKVEGPKVDPARALLAFENARAEFRQDPSVDRLGQVHQLCTQLHGALSGTPATKDKVRSIDCDPKQAAEASAALFALNAGFKTFEARCAGGDKLVSLGTADALFGFAKKCLADSGLPSKDTDELRTKISFTEMTRDDRAHRFVVTWNAFNDGNRLAYLALAIAVGIDSLIFMTGLFGANAVRSPLSDVPGLKARTARQLEAIIENALLPDRFDNARLTLQAMRPVTNEEGYMAEVRLDGLDPHVAGRVLTVLNAGATINAVAYDEARDRHLVRAELFEFLSIVAKKAFEENRENIDLAELEKVVHVALLPDVGAGAETVLHYMHPIGEEHGFTAEIKLGDVDKADLGLVRSTLNAAATLQRVQRVANDSTHFFIHRDLYRTLARIRAASFAPVRQERLAAPRRAGAREGGSLKAETPILENRSAGGHPRLTRIEVPKARHQELRIEKLAELITSLGMEADAYNLMSSGAMSAAIAAERVFSRLRQSNQNLDDILTERDEQARTVLHNAYERLNEAIENEAEREALKSAYHEIEENWAVVMLLPGGAFETVLKRVVDVLEPQNADGELSGDQLELLWVAKRLYRALELSSRSTETSWRRVEKHLMEPEEGLSSPTQTAHGGSKRTLN